MILSASLKIASTQPMENNPHQRVQRDHACDPISGPGFVHDRQRARTHKHTARQRSPRSPRHRAGRGNLQALGRQGILRNNKDGRVKHDIAKSPAVGVDGRKLERGANQLEAAHSRDQHTGWYGTRIKRRAAHQSQPVAWMRCTHNMLHARGAARDQTGSSDHAINVHAVPQDRQRGRFRVEWHAILETRNGAVRGSQVRQ